MWPKKWELLFIALCRILPEWVLFLLKWLPSRTTMRRKWFRDVATKVSRLIFEKQLIEVANDPNPSEKDIVNVLVISHHEPLMSHLTNDAKKKMSDAEIDSQLA
ncbi:hypothetical protein ARMGADRAFT_1071031 [Armillaria gallica]|uniref:Uncharacterized protein n=1 Tax=Armillaria gallica TaxID=47427 RepID=A0A2H3EEE7_ARMGA|nr:hypothetical protein ARMGADRAFT_1071031 [Armillaria gallica]